MDDPQILSWLRACPCVYRKFDVRELRESKIEGEEGRFLASYGMQLLAVTLVLGLRINSGGR